jgi:hypothetical protein
MAGKIGKQRLRWERGGSGLSPFALSCWQMSGGYITNGSSAGVMHTTSTIEKSRETVVVTGRSGLIGSAFIDHVGDDYTSMGFDCKGPSRPAPKTAHVIWRIWSRRWYSQLNAARSFRRSRRYSSWNRKHSVTTSFNVPSAVSFTPRMEDVSNPQDISQAWLLAPELLARSRPVPQAVDDRSL